MPEQAGRSQVVDLAAYLTAPGRPVARPRAGTADAVVIGLILGYFALRVATRVAFGPGLEPDEAEAFLFARRLEVGYPAQPPLYFWVQHAAFAALGPSVLALSAVKNAILAATFAALYLFLRRGAAPLGAAAAAFSLFLVYDFSWEALRGLTHTYLVILLTVLTLACVWRLSQGGRLRDYALLGLIAGLGLLSKYNYVFVPLAAVVALGAVPGRWSRLDAGGLLLATLIALAMAAPTMLWMNANPGVATSSVWKLGVRPDHALPTLAAGTAAFLRAGMQFFLTAAATFVVLLAIGRRAGADRAPVPALARYLMAASAAMLLLFWLSVLSMGATDVYRRWLLPAGLPFVAGAALAVQARLRPAAGAALAAAGALSALASLAALPWFSLVDPGYRGGDYAALDRAIRAVDPAPRTIFSDGFLALGNLALLGQGADLRWWLDGPPGPCGGVAVLFRPPADALAVAGLEGRAGTPVPFAIALPTGPLPVTLVPIADAPSGCPAR
ncbi:MAG: glycosyltransferase family 39 protein [Rhodobacteraceae bacterium]|nr:glycosyltransferase family 39 protein [Paracoccaceae bacterium]